MTNPTPKRNLFPWIIIGAAVLLVCCVAVVAAGGLYYLYGVRIDSVVTQPAIVVTVEEEAAQPTQQPEATKPPEQASTPTNEPANTPSADVTQQTSAQEPNFSYANVSLYIDPRIASGAQGETIPAVTSNDTAPWDVGPQHTVITLEGYPEFGALHKPQIFVYPVDGLVSITPELQERIDEHDSVMKTRPSGSEVDYLPFLPRFNAAQVLQGRVGYLNFASGSGYRFLTTFAQSFYPVTNSRLLYTFQGITQDGKYYIAVVLPLTHPDLPRVEDVILDDAFANQYPSYIAGMETTLGEWEAGSFNPVIDELDALVESIQIK